ncbi:MAG: hypothetical protein GY705_13345 [Bacteroidetes bacterium]|nr:hypothetical protein [Bacteroidota bacterium]
MTKKKEKQDYTVIARAVIIAIFLMGLGAIAVNYLERLWAGLFPNYMGQIRTGVMLFILWLVVTSTLRSIDKLNPGSRGWTFVISGAFIALGGFLLYNLFLFLVNQFSSTSELLPVWGMIPLFTGIGLILGLISLINLRVKNRKFGNVLEVLVVVAVLFLFLYFVQL